jgi:hypothetical protein
MTVHRMISMRGLSNTLGKDRRQQKRPLIGLLNIEHVSAGIVFYDEVN